VSIGQELNSLNQYDIHGQDLTVPAILKDLVLDP
jgi:hypothetical protein